jgi:hypothetical protein
MGPSTDFVVAEGVGGATISCLPVGRAGSAEGTIAVAGELVSVRVNKPIGSSQRNAAIERTTARTTATTGPDRAFAEVDDGSLSMEECRSRSFNVKRWGTAAGEGMAGFAIMMAPLMTGVRARLP